MGQRDTNGKEHGSKVKAILVVPNHLILGFTFGSQLDMHCTIQILSSDSFEAHQLLGAAEWHLKALGKVMLFFWARELRTLSMHPAQGIKWPRKHIKSAVEIKAVDDQVSTAVDLSPIPEDREKAGMAPRGQSIASLSDGIWVDLWLQR